MTDQSYLGQEVLEPDGFMQPKRYRILCRCNRCGNEYSYVVSKLTTRDRPCPRKACKEAVFEEDVERRARHLAQMIEDQRAPAHIGDKIVVKAVDKTADVVMTDYGLTDLKDNIRPGESMAPKLAPPMQAAADNFFNKNPLQSQGVGSRQAQLLGRRAIAGAFRGMAVNPGQVVPGSPGVSPMRLVRTEK
jgi:hypothetical protein